MGGREPSYSLDLLLDLYSGITSGGTRNHILNRTQFSHMQDKCLTCYHISLDLESILSSLDHLQILIYWKARNT